MNYIEFKKIKIQNFLSVGNDPVIINFKKGLNVITGINKDKDQRSNGTGKSTVGKDSLYYALFGTTLRNLNKKDLINKVSKGESFVELEFIKDEIEYKIIRSLKPAKLELWINEVDKTRDSINNTQSEIKKILNITEDVIKNCIILGINDTIPFMAQSKVDKRKFIEGIFNLDFFSLMLKDVRSESNEKSKEYKIIESLLNEKNKNIQTYIDEEKNFNNVIESEINAVKSNITNFVNDVKTLKEDINQVNEDKINECEQNIDKCNNIDEQLNQKIDLFKENIIKVNTFIESNKEKIKNVISSGKCPTCLHILDANDEEHIKQHIDEIQNSINEYKDKLKILNDSKDKLVENKKKVKEKRNQIEEIIIVENKKKESNERINIKIENNFNRIEEYKKQIEIIKTRENTFNSLINKTNSEIETLDIELKELLEECDILDKIKFIFSEEGIKSFIINKMLDVLNSKINTYLDKLNANCILTFDQYFDEKIINDKNIECSYFNFSSGERRNIDIAIMFAFMDIQKLQGQFDTNISIYDELIDSSLDEEGVRFVIDILKDKVINDNKAIYLITHRKECENIVDGEIIYLEKINGKTRIKNEK